VIPRRLPVLLFAVALALPFLWRLDAEEFHGDESHWISSGQQALALLTAGRLGDRQWRDEFYFYSQPQVGKVLIGLALAGAGIAGPTPIYDYDWQLRPWENRAAGRVPAPEAILAGRTVGALSGWVACLALWALGAALGAPSAGAVGALLLASHPLWLANARRAGLDAPALALGLLAATVAVWALKEVRSPKSDVPSPKPRASEARPATWDLRPGTFGLLLLAGVTAGLAAGTKYVALLALPAALIPFVAALRARTGRARAGLVGVALLALLLTVLVFWATDPALYPDPIAGLRTSLDFLTTQAAAMRSRSPVFQSPPLIAAEVIDRTVWPLGFPKVVDLTLPDPLSPGSYGTPVVALGALAGLVALASAPHGRRAPPLAVACWTAVVYLALVGSVPIWWERWHLPLVPPLCLLAGLGLVALAGGSVTLALLAAGAQYVAALAMGPSYLGNGFGALLGTPLGLGVHLLVAVGLFVHLLVRARVQANWSMRWQTAPRRVTRRAIQRATAPYASASSAPAGSPKVPTSPATSARRGSSSTPPVT
jgi:hypothetical protein